MNVKYSQYLCLQKDMISCSLVSFQPICIKRCQFIENLSGYILIILEKGSRKRFGRDIENSEQVCSARLRWVTSSHQHYADADL